MFTSLSKLGSYRVDYVNHTAAGTTDALAFYVLGDLQEGQAYSTSAKHALFTGLDIIRNSYGLENLVAIYMDVNTADNPERPAYLQMKQDLENGIVNHVFVLYASHLVSEGESSRDWERFSRSIGGVEVLVDRKYNEGMAVWVENKKPSQQKRIEKVS